MEFLNKAASQVTELFKGMTPAARLTSGMLLVLVVVSLGYLITFGGGKANRYLYGGREFSDQDITKIANAFAAENLDDYEYDGRRIRVPGAKFSVYMQAMTKAGFTPSDAELESVEPGIFESELDKNRRHTGIMQKKLASTLAKRPDLDWATVQFREVKVRGIGRTTKSSAAVAISGKNNLPVDRATVASIRATTAAWFTIDENDVAVTDVNGTTVAIGDTLDGIDPEADRYLMSKLKQEEYFRNKILGSVAYIGPGVVAAVNVELDPTVTHKSESIKIDPQGTLTTESETYSKSNDSRPAQGGRPGAQPNEVQGNEPRTLVASNQQQSTSDESRELQSTIAGHEKVSQTKAAFVPTMVTATVTIPRSYFRNVWKQEQIAAGTEDPGDPDDTQTAEVESRIIPQIEEQIANTLPPLEAGEDKFPLVEVGTYEDIPIEEPEPPSIATIAFTWFSDNWRTLGLFGIGVISLFILRSMLKAPAFQPPVQAPEAEISEEEEEEEVEDEPQVMLNRKAQPTGISLREELISMVREDPDAAANVLRTWIGDAA